MMSFEPGGLAVVVGASGGIGAAVTRRLRADGSFSQVIGLARGRGSEVDISGFDLTDETSIVTPLAQIRESDAELRLVFDATGFLHGDGFQPEKSLSAIDATHMARAFAVNAIGPALLLKHLLPLLPKAGKSVFATLSAKVGSIGDNSLGGWYSYRASKAALNQLVHTAAIELARRAPEALCVSLHPGTVSTGLSDGFAKHGLTVRSPEQAAADLLQVLDRLDKGDSGGFFDYAGTALPW